MVDRLLTIMAGICRFSIGLKMINPNSTRRIFRLSLLAILAASGPLSAATIETGKTLVMERGKGNCLACHAIDDGVLPGNLGPPLIAMKARFPDQEVLFKQIWDATVRNPDSRMPPFGKHGILSSDEIRLIMEYLYTL